MVALNLLPTRPESSFCWSRTCMALKLQQTLTVIRPPPPVTHPQAHVRTHTSYRREKLYDMVEKMFLLTDTQETCI